MLVRFQLRRMRISFLKEREFLTEPSLSVKVRPGFINDAADFGILV